MNTDKKLISVVMPYRCEPKANIDCTIESLKATGIFFEMHVAEDVSGIGCGPMRHRLITEAMSDTILVIDPHMRFAADSLPMMLEYHLKNPEDLVCASCWADPAAVVGYGAKIKRFEPEYKRIFGRPWIKTKTELEVFSQALGAAQDTGSAYQVPCILGACYMLSKAHYLTRLGGLWQYLTSTGWSEQSISVMQALTGGKCVCLPDAKVIHDFTNSVVNPYPQVQKWQILNNQLFMLYCFVPQENWKEYEDCLQLPTNRTVDYGIKHLCKLGAMAKIGVTLEKYQTKSYQEVSQIWE